MSAAKQSLFCCYCALLGNSREAAVRAGYPVYKAGDTALALLKKQAVREEIARYVQALEQSGFSKAKTGLERIAFGDVNDAVRLLLQEDLGAGELAALDLFCVKEIKKPKGGGLEIRFHDRKEALELLLKAEENGGEPERSSFYRALEESARALGAAGDNDAV